MRRVLLVVALLSACVREVAAPSVPTRLEFVVTCNHPSLWWALRNDTSVFVGFPLLTPPVDTLVLASEPGVFALVLRELDPAGGTLLAYRFDVAIAGASLTITRPCYQP